MYRPYSTGVLGGLNEDENPHAVRPGELVPPTMNVARFGNMVGTRPGLQAFGSGKEYENQLTGGFAICGIVDWRSGFDSSRQLIVVARFGGVGRIWYDDASQYPAGSATMGGQATDVWNFAVHQNKLWGAGGANRNNSGSDSLWYLADPTDTGTGPVAVDVQDSAAATVRPGYVFAFKEYLLINGLQAGALADNNPTVTRYCTFAADPTNAANWATGNTLGFAASRKGIDSYGLNFATGFARYTDNNNDFLLTLGNKYITSWILDTTGSNDFICTDNISPGSVCQRTFVSLGLDSGDAIYVSERGIHSLRQSQQYGARESSFLTWKIRPTWATINKSLLKYAVGAYDWQNGRVVFALPTGSNTYNDLILVLDVKDLDSITAENARWYVWRLSPPASDSSNSQIHDMAYARDEDGVWRLMAGTRGGKILYFDDDAFNDVGEAYTATIRTAHVPHGSLMDSTTIGNVVLTLGPGGSQTPTYRTVFDYGRRTGPDISLDMNLGGGFVLGDSSIPGSLLGVGGGVLGGGSGTVDQKVYGVGSGRTISHEITHDTASEPFLIGRIDYEVDVSGEDVGDVAA